MCVCAQLLKYVNQRLTTLARQPSAAQPPNSQESVSAQLLRNILAALPVSPDGIVGDGTHSSGGGGGGSDGGHDGGGVCKS